MSKLIKGDVKKLWDNVNTGNKVNKVLFFKWFEENKIIGMYDYLESWKQVTKNGIRGIRDIGNRGHTSWVFKDHTTMWKMKNGKKIIICHDYKLKYNYEDDFIKLIDWANNRNLDIILYGTECSWYYPGKTYMYGIIEKTN